LRPGILVSVFEEKGKLAPSSIQIAIAALRLPYRVTLKKDWVFTEVIPSPKAAAKLPVVLSPDEVRRFRRCLDSVKHRAILTTCYGAGLRVSETVCLKTTDIDSRNMTGKDFTADARTLERLGLADMDGLEADMYAQRRPRHCPVG
jgi:site-specific recombinase XerD